ncbi:MAG: hypothetical protein ABI231_01860 [Candidatus Tumulicola sp.]
MKHSTILASLAAAAFVVAAAGSATLSASAETIVYEFPALPGPVANCQWFDDNVNDRSIGAMIRQTDLLYNRTAPPPEAAVAVAQTATTALDARLVQFTLNGRLLCLDASALHAEATQPSPPPR